MKLRDVCVWHIGIVGQDLILPGHVSEAAKSTLLTP
jgi:hypothetical protein